MFFDRLDEPIIRFAADVAQGDVEPVVPALGQTWDTRVLVPPQAWGNGYDLPSGKAKLIGHMRNRVYLPRLMRFAQRDPNATGQLVMAAVMHSGQSMSAHPGGMQLESLFGDGPNLHGYLAGRPRGNSDPTGLFLPSPADLVASAVMVGVRGLRGGLEGMTEQYAANLEDDLDWAMDWSRPDNDYSRLSSTWVGQSFMDGMYGGLIDGLNDAVSDMTWGAWPDADGAGNGLVVAGKPKRALRNLANLGAKGLSSAVKLTMKKHGPEMAKRPPSRRGPGGHQHKAGSLHQRSIWSVFSRSTRSFHTASRSCHCDMGWVKWRCQTGG